jgi:hypothetical protein
VAPCRQSANAALCAACHGRMVRGGHGLPKVSVRPAMPGPSTFCGRTTPETALCPFQGWPTRKMGGLRLSSTPLLTRRHTPMNLDTKQENQLLWSRKRVESRSTHFILLWLFRFQIGINDNPHSQATWSEAQPFALIRWLRLWI